IATYQTVSGTRHVSVPGIVLTSRLRDWIEALFLGSGRFTPSDGFAACDAGTAPILVRWPRGAPVQVLLSTTSSPHNNEDVTRVARQISGATNGVITASADSTTNPDPIPSKGQVPLTLHPNPSAAGCEKPWGCVILGYQGAYPLGSGRAVLDNTVPP